METPGGIGAWRSLSETLGGGGGRGRLQPWRAECPRRDSHNKGTGGPRTPPCTVQRTPQVLGRAGAPGACKSLPEGSPGNLKRGRIGTRQGSTVFRQKPALRSLGIFTVRGTTKCGPIFILQTRLATGISGMEIVGRRDAGCIGCVRCRALRWSPL